MMTYLLTGNKSSTFSLAHSRLDPNLVLSGSEEDVRLFDLRTLGESKTRAGCVSRMHSPKFARGPSIDNAEFDPLDSRRAYVTKGNGLFEFDWRRPNNNNSSPIPMFVNEARESKFAAEASGGEHTAMDVDEKGAVLLGSDSGDLVFGRWDELRRLEEGAHANVVSCVKMLGEDLALSGGFDNRLILWEVVRRRGGDETMRRCDVYDAPANVAAAGSSSPTNINPPHVYSFDASKNEVVVGLGNGDVHIVDVVDLKQRDDDDDESEIPRRRLKIRSAFEGMHYSPVVDVTTSSQSDNSASTIYVTCGADQRIFALFGTNEDDDDHNLEAELLVKHSKAPNVVLAFDDWLVVGDVSNEISLYRGLLV